jgi:Ca-activated chloride channel family protein
MQLWSYIIYYPIIVWIFLVLISGGYILLLFRSEKKQNFWDIELLQEIYKHDSWWYRIYIVILIAITLIYSLAWSGIYKIWEIEKIKKDGIDIEIIFDVSYSMVAKDILPSRLDAAKAVFSNFVWWLNSDRVGLILFAGKPFQSIPLTYDYSFLQDFIETLSVESIDQSQNILQGTAIGDALVLGTGVLEKESSEREKVIILITDGTANRWVEPELALKFVKDKWIKTYTIWVGKDEDTTIDTLVAPWFIQKTPVWGIDEIMLQRIASETGWEYFRADSEAALENILETIWKLEKSPIEQEIYRFYTPVLYKILGIIFVIYIWLMYLLFIKKIQF